MKRIILALAVMCIAMSSFRSPNIYQHNVSSTDTIPYYKYTYYGYNWLRGIFDSVLTLPNIDTTFGSDTIRYGAMVFRNMSSTQQQPYIRYRANWQPFKMFYDTLSSQGYVTNNALIDSLQAHTYPIPTLQQVTNSGNSTTLPITANSFIKSGSDSLHYLMGDGSTSTVGTGLSLTARLLSNTGVLSFSTGTTGLTPSSPTSGNVVLSGILGIKNGGTGDTTGQAQSTVGTLTNGFAILGLPFNGLNSFTWNIDSSKVTTQNYVNNRYVAGTGIAINHSTGVVSNTGIISASGGFGILVSGTNPLLLAVDSTKVTTQNYVNNYYKSGSGVNVNNSTGIVSLNPAVMNTTLTGFLAQTGVVSSADSLYKAISKNSGNAINEHASGVYSFSGVTKASTTTVNIGAAQGFITNSASNPVYPTWKYITYAGAIGVTDPYVTTSTESFIMLDTTGSIVWMSSFPTPAQRRSYIYLGKTSHPAKDTITAVYSEPDQSLSPLSQVRDMFTPIHLINQGVYPSANGANLNINVSGGTLWGLGINFVTSNTSPSSETISGQSPASFAYQTQTGIAPVITTSINPNNYDLNGVVTPIGGGANSSTNQRIYLLQNGSIRIQYGQTVYSNLSAAIAGIQSEKFVTFPNYTNNAILIAILSVQKGATALNNTAVAQFFNVSKFGDVTGAAGGAATTTLQQAYNNSTPPQITTTSALGALQIKRGSAADTDPVLQILNGAGTATFSVTGAGSATATNYIGQLNSSLSTGAGLTGGPFNNTSNVTISIPAGGVTNTMLVNSTISGTALGGTLPTLSFGTHFTGGNYNGTAAISEGLDATNLNTASTIVARDASGNFSAGTITATLSGTATQVSNSLSSGFGLLGGPYNGSSPITLNADSTKLTTQNYVNNRYTGGTGISVNNSTGVISNTGIISASGGTGISVSGTNPLTIVNTGIISATAGPGISVSGTNPLTISNTGIVSLSAGTDISISGTNPATINNTSTLQSVTNRGNTTTNSISSANLYTTGSSGIGTSSPSLVTGYNTMTVNGTSGSIYEWMINGVTSAQSYTNSSGWTFSSFGANPIIFYTKGTHSSPGNPALSVDTNAFVNVNNQITSPKFITSGGTPSQFVKGDGSLDGTSYLPSANISGTANYLPVFTGANTLANSPVYYSSGTIGINAPVSINSGDNINVSGQGRFTGWYTSGGGGPAAEVGYFVGRASIIGYNRSPNEFIPLLLQGGSTSSNSMAELISNGYTYILNSSGQNIVSIDSAGNIVAAGTNGSNVGFQLGKTYAEQPGRFYQLNGSGYLDFSAHSGSTAAYGARWYVPDATGDMVYANAPSGTAGSLTYTDRLRIFNNGDISIGTNTDFGYKLNLNGNQDIISASGTTQTTFLNMLNSTNNSYLDVTGAGTSSVVPTWQDGSMIIEGVPYNSTGSTIIGSYRGSLKFQTNSRTDYLTLESNGHFLVNTSTDNSVYEFQVNGKSFLEGDSVSLNLNTTSIGSSLHEKAFNTSASSDVGSGTGYYGAEATLNYNNAFNYTGVTGTSQGAFRSTLSLYAYGSPTVSNTVLGSFLPTVTAFGTGTYQNVAAIRLDYPFTYTDGTHTSYSGKIDTFSAFYLAAPVASTSIRSQISTHFGIYQASADSNYFNGVITAPSFYQSSDKRLKTLIQTSPNLTAVLNIPARLYIKNGQKELGYFAQDWEKILPEAIGQLPGGYLSLNYTEVLVAKVAALEDENRKMKKYLHSIQTQIKSLTSKKQP